MKYITSFITIIMLCACGSGSDSDEDGLDSSQSPEFTFSPHVDAGSDLSVVGGVPLQVVAEITDKDSQEFVYKWSQVSGPAVTINDLGIGPTQRKNKPIEGSVYTADSRVEIVTPTVSEPTFVELRLDAGDDGHLSGNRYDIVKINILPGAIGRVELPDQFDESLFNNSEVTLFTLDNLQEPLSTTITSKSANKEGSGYFGIDQSLLSEGKLYLLRATLGPSSSIALTGTRERNELYVHGVFTAEQLRSGSARVSPYSELVYQIISYQIVTGQKNETILTTVDKIASSLFGKDITGDSLIDYRDIAYWTVSHNEDFSLSIDFFNTLARGEDHVRVLANTYRNRLSEDVTNSIFHASLDFAAIIGQPVSGNDLSLRSDQSTVFAFTNSMLYSLDTSAIENIKLVDSISYTGEFVDADIDNSRIYLATTTTALEIIDIAENKTLTSLYKDIRPNATGIEAKNSYVFLAEMEQNTPFLTFYDAQDVSAVTQIFPISPLMRAYGMEVVDNELIVVEGGISATSLDITTPSNPTIKEGLSLSFDTYIGRNSLHSYLVKEGRLKVYKDRPVENSFSPYSLETSYILPNANFLGGILGIDYVYLVFDSFISVLRFDDTQNELTVVANIFGLNAITSPELIEGQGEVAIYTSNQIKFMKVR